MITRSFSSRLTLVLVAVLTPIAVRSGEGADAPVAFFDREDIERAKDRAERFPWAKRLYAEIIRVADRWVEEPAPLPEGPTGYYHDYFCPDHGVLLRYDPERPRAHACPEDGTIWRGPKLDAYWVTATLRAQLDAAVNCGLAWRFTGNEAYARAAAAVLGCYARHYRDHIAHQTPPRWMQQGLDEAVYILDAVRVFELVSGSPALTPEAAQAVAEDYLIPTARFLVGERRLIHNIHSWYNGVQDFLRAAFR